jgi:hypothetical protein
VKRAGLIVAIVASALGLSRDVFANEAADPAGGVIRLDETVISGNQELPKVLYILPWRQPEGLPEIDVQVPDSEAQVFRRLYPPAYRREIDYYRSLEDAAGR